MAAMAESRMNLAALQQRDPYITGIVDSASQVALYSFSPTSNEWEKTEVEGTLFVYTRSASPINGFMILNRLGRNDQVEPINKNLEFQLQDPFLLYRNSQSSIFGIWFYDKDECARIGQLMNSLVQVSVDQQHQKKENSSANRQRRASESDTLLEHKQSMPMMGHSNTNNVDIMQMLSKAQHEYDKSKGDAPVPSSSKEPKPLIDNPNASATKSSTLIKPLALKMGHSQDCEDGEGSTTPNTQITLDTLFQRATSVHDSHSNSNKHSGVGPPPAEQMLPLLQRLMSTPAASSSSSGGSAAASAATVEEIERQQRSADRDQMPKPAGEEAPPIAGLNNGRGGGLMLGGSQGMMMMMGRAQQQHQQQQQQQQRRDDDAEPESPNTALRRTLNIGGAGGGGGGGVRAPQRQMSVPSSSTSSSSSCSLMPSSSAAASFASSASAANAQMKVSMATSGLITPEALIQGVLPSNATTTPPSQSIHYAVSSSSGPPPSSSVLLTPMVFQQSAAATSMARASPPVGSALPMPSTYSLGQTFGSSHSGGLSDSCSNASLSPCPDRPMATFTSAADNAAISPLTKQQLQQALIHLLKSDSSFLTSIHEAYVQSLNQELISKLEKL